ncbi:conserved unknown protein [Ectocarpus siliculosus]|uniref:Uncharacterized protein n=1 Tax=Ectocarpus siliculosus TaxID=2880 RepID=D7FPU0_ECTSI|nr:conserved unknown protein [Ectocarpus siliculosus]|eukprot:CBJ30547.1 conserved unknown protein [Ectocarpus siliculosus]
MVGWHLLLSFDGVTLDLAQSWENGEEMAPIFSGACWAGTVVWPAALDLCDYMSEHLRQAMVGATVVELGCGIGVPGMVARLLGATVVLTEQDELLSLLDRNLDGNFAGHPRGEGGIRREALDWEREADTDGLLASLERSGTAPGEAEGEPGAGVRRRSTRLDFVLCADCVFEPLYGDSWKALAKVMGRLSDAGTTVLCSVERRGVDGVPEFLRACEAEGFSLQTVYRAAPSAPAPVELYEFSKGVFRGEAVAVVESDGGMEGGDGKGKPMEGEGGGALEVVDGGAVSPGAGSKSTAR